MTVNTHRENKLAFHTVCYLQLHRWGASEMGRGPKRSRRTGDEEIFDGIADVDRLATWARLFIWAIGGTLFTVFTWLQIRDIPIRDFLSSATSTVIIKSSLIFYYACWIGGTTFDVRIQQKAYVSDPDHGQITNKTIAVTIGFFLVAFALLWVSSNDLSILEIAISRERTFAALLAMFVLANFFGWQHIVKRVRRPINASREKFKDGPSFFRLEQLNIVERYIAGNWQVKRFYVMFALVAITNILCFSKSAQESLAFLIGLFQQDLANPIAELSPGLSIAAFVLVAEGWIWIRRLNTYTALRVIDGLKHSYVLTPRRS